MRALSGVAFVIVLQIVSGLSLSVSRPGAFWLGAARRTVSAGGGIRGIPHQQFSMSDRPAPAAPTSHPVPRLNARVGVICPEELSEVSTMYQSDHGDGGAPASSLVAFCSSP